jgi:Flp pilus assembly pilin Flp
MTKFPELRSENGQTMAEYSIVLAVITPAIVLTIALMAGTIADLVQKIVDVLS